MRIFVITFLLLVSTGCGQMQEVRTIKQGNAADTIKSDIKTMDSDYSPTFEKAHPVAKRLMNDEFYFSVIEGTAPFGSDDGADTYAGFKSWRPAHSSESPIRFLQDQIEDWGYPQFDIKETSFEKLMPYLKENHSGFRAMTGIDAAIVATAFGQLYLEGTIAGDIKDLAKISVKRELLPEILAFWEEDANVRQAKLHKLMKVLEEVE
ncbi:hypothetical protein AB6805_17020 [Chitinophaga sp. RCC_12]|uniref:hypothetical protein n=1 Tax=Chitinophaga sp. RCC_12 TaxID=3239226 RepID=UPI003525398B